MDSVNNKSPHEFEDFGEWADKISEDVGNELNELLNNNSIPETSYDEELGKVIKEGFNIQPEIEVNTDNPPTEIKVNKEGPQPKSSDNKIDLEQIKLKITPTIEPLKRTKVQENATRALGNTKNFKIDDPSLPNWASNLKIAAKGFGKVVLGLMAVGLCLITVPAHFMIRSGKQNIEKLKIQYNEADEKYEKTLSTRNEKQKNLEIEEKKFQMLEQEMKGIDIIEKFFNDHEEDDDPKYTILLLAEKAGK